MRRALFAVALVACSSGGGGSDAPACSDYATPAGFDAQNPKVSFQTDVMKVFGLSCAFSSCHADASNGVVLGPNASVVYPAVVGAKSSELTTMNFVTPNDPGNSYLMRKMDASQCLFDEQCTTGTCQDTMPRGGGTLDTDTRDVVRRWILQGAQNN